MDNEKIRIKNGIDFYQDIKELILKEQSNELKEINFLIDSINKSKLDETDSIELIAMKIYIQTKNMTFVADEINKLGYRVESLYKNGNKSLRKYDSNDIRDLIFSKEFLLNINNENNIMEFFKACELIYSRNRSKKLLKRTWR